MRRLAGPGRFKRILGRKDGTRLDVGFTFVESVENVVRHPELLRKHILRRQIDPVGDRERAVPGEGAVVERQNEVAGIIADALDRVAVPLCEVPEIAGLEVIDLACAGGLKHDRLGAPLDHIGPLGGDCMPMQLALSASQSMTRAANPPP